MATTTNPENLRLNKRRFFLIVEQILVFPSSNKLEKLIIFLQISNKLENDVSR